MQTDPSDQARLDPAPRPYRAPEVSDLGVVSALTAGPSGGSLDQLEGASGGFQDDPTS